MRIEPENGIITLMRGDSLTTPIYINVGTKLQPKHIKLTENDKLYFGLMEPGQAFEDAVMKKVFDHTSPTDDDGNTLLILQPQDTEKLLVGKYYYMIKLRSVNSWGQEMVRTIVPSTLFWLEGNNPEQNSDKYYEQGKYDVEHLILEGGEFQEVIFEGGEVEVQNIIFEGGEIV